MRECGCSSETWVAGRNVLGTEVLRWRTWTWLIAIAAAGPTVLYASPYGPARNLAHAGLLILAYPAWFLLSLVWLVPGIALVRRFGLAEWWVLPSTAVLIETSVSAVRHWPPTKWGAAVIEFIGPTPPRIDHWYFYFYSLWPGAFEALVSALVLLAARNFFRPNIRSTQQPA